MPRLAITHRTSYDFANPVQLGPHRLMLRPRETRDLSVISFDLDITPRAQLDWSYDVAGNAVAAATFSSPTDALVIEAKIQVLQSAQIWPVFAIASDAVRYPFAYQAEDRTDLEVLTTPQYVDIAGRLKAWASAFIMAEPTDTLSLLKDISFGITSQIAYQSRETEGTQGPLETLDRGWGSCRDFAVLFAEAVRCLSFGARLVSGYLFDPEATSIGSSGSGSTHAWVEVFVPGAGWIAFDPTNKAVGSAHLIPVAVARNITQIAPITGSFRAHTDPAPSMKISVSVEQI